MENASHKKYFGWRFVNAPPPWGAAVKRTKALPIIITMFFIVACASRYTVDKELVEKFEVVPHQALLVVKVHSAEYTGQYPECLEDNCIPFYFWYVYKAQVLDVLEGSFDADYLTFAALHHAYFVKEVTDEWYILIEKFSDNEVASEIGAEYQVIEHDARAFHDG